MTSDGLFPRRDPDEPPVGPEPEEGGERDARVQCDEGRQLIVTEVQQVIVEGHRGILYQQADAVQHGEEDDLTRDTRTLPGPEGPVAVAQEGNDRRDDSGDRGGRDWPDAEVDEQDVV